ncbi:hypothetical protein Y003_14235 [Staphylococcus aureus MUM475]|nr:hypothetical protein Y003_14235 [Staphylococcus aureus MUM475]
MGPNIEADEKSAYNNVQVGVGPNIEKLDCQFLQTMQVGWDNEINFAKISFLSHSLMHEFYSCNFIFMDILHLANV